MYCACDANPASPVPVRSAVRPEYSVEAAEASEAHRRLAASRYGELSRISCDFHEGVLTLRGRVSSFYLKQIAQSVVRHVPGVELVVNHLEVLHAEAAPHADASAAASASPARAHHLSASAGRSLAAG